MNQLGSTTWLTEEEVGSQEAQCLEAGLGDTLPFPLADRGRLDVKKTGYSSRPSQFIDELLAVHIPEYRCTYCIVNRLAYFSFR